ncbi:MAG TPA: hypothetical protein VGK81_07200, partial [Anaerolineae bacterium]
MYVVRHDGKGIEFHSMEMLRQRPPACLYHLTQRAELHHTFGDIPEQAFALVCTQGDEIRAGLGVV